MNKSSERNCGGAREYPRCLSASRTLFFQFSGKSDGAPFGSRRSSDFII